MKRITTLFAAAALALAVSVPAVLAKGGDGTRIVLKPAKAFPAAKGSAKLQTKAGERQLEVEVEHVRRLAGTRVTFVVGGKKLGTAKVNALGSAQIERRNAAVPAVRAGTAVSVRTAGGAQIVRGSF
ncbi:MAG TPA: hypothetical protein VLD16_08030 [Gaiellaceae bacterium]|nr:hypothetical protein [Gaiellaceae bacterium]